MVFPAETTKQLRRRIIDICQDHARKVLDATRELPSLLDAYSRDDAASIREHVSKIQKIEEEANELKRVLMTELTEAGAILLSREDFLRLVAASNEMVDSCGAIAFRISELNNMNWKANTEMVSDLIKLSEASLNVITRLRETIFSLSFSAQRTAELARNVDSAEEIVDIMYRKVDLKIISSNMKIPLIFILRDIAFFLEDMADKAEDVADAARILSLSAF